MKAKLYAPSPRVLTIVLAAAICISTPTVAFADERDDRIAELEAQIAVLEAQIADLQFQLDEALSGAQSTNQEAYEIGETWVVEGQWKVTIESVEETTARNEYADTDPDAVYIVTYTYENLGYVDEYDIMDGLYISLDDTIVDSTGKVGYSYPGDIVYYPVETPVGATCEAQVCIGVDNAGDFQIHFSTYDGNDEKQSAVFHVTV